MMKPEKSRYWLFQLLGWGIFAFINIFFAIVFNQHVSTKMIYRLVFFIELGILFSHLMREIIRKYHVLLRSLQQQIVIFTALTIFFAFALAAVQTPFEEICGLRSVSNTKAQFANVFFFNNFAPAVPLLFMWNSVYFMYHYVRKSRRQQMETLQLAALVKALELKTIKAHINPHFIFNSLNSIRALIDENPQRARNAITELSNILRSSLNTEKGETVPFKEELKIVKDYLALENMRFEDRLRVEYDVDEQTLNQPVPPMMLQTLVENAIKHGISKQLEGGVVKIISDNKKFFHELMVQNTGYLNGGTKHSGFGISSTQDRLNLLYGSKATFEIKQLSPTLVEAKVLIPLNLN